MTAHPNEVQVELHIMQKKRREYTKSDHTIYLFNYLLVTNTESRHVQNRESEREKWIWRHAIYIKKEA
jgi:hypothetical protein